MNKNEAKYQLYLIYKETKRINEICEEKKGEKVFKI